MYGAIVLCRVGGYGPYGYESGEEIDKEGYN